jgi:hypothetical protein
MERREAPHQLHLAVPRPLRRTLRPAALHRGVLRRPGRAFGGFSRFAFGPQARPLSEHPPSPSGLRRTSRAFRASGAQAARTVSQLLAGGLIAPGRSPGAARARSVRFASPAGTAPCSVVVTPREDALSRTRQGVYNLNVGMLSRGFSRPIDAVRNLLRRAAFAPTEKSAPQPRADQYPVCACPRGSWVKCRARKPRDQKPPAC